MTTTPLDATLQRLRRSMLAQSGAGLTDGELLECFLSRRDEAAFEALVRRHGPMVFGVCRRVLGNEADAEDAFQATFLVLVRKAASIRPRGMVGNWLYGVAHNTALKALAMNRRRHTKEREAGTRSRRETHGEVWQEVQAILDAELSGLPEQYRAAIVLCDLEGKTLREAASHLGWPQGTVATRLRRGRALLAKRLSGRGLTLSAGVVAAAVSQGAASAGVPASLVHSTVKAANVHAAGRAATAGMVSAKVAALTEGVVKAIFLTRLKVVAVLLLVVGLFGAGLGMSLLTDRGQAAEPPKAEARPDEKKDNKDVPDDSKLLQGTWKVVALEANGSKAPVEDLGKMRWVIKGTDLESTDSNGEAQEKASFKLDSSKSPGHIDLVPRQGPAKGKVVQGIYKLESGRLTLCIRDAEIAEKGRPGAFKTDKESGLGLIVLERVDPPRPPAADPAGRDKAADDKARKMEEMQQKLLLLQTEIEVHKLQFELLKRDLEAAKGIAGVLRKVDVNKSTINITFRKTTLPMENIPLAIDVKFFLDGKECSIDDLKPGMAVALEVRNTDDKTLVSALKATSPKKDDK